jgi:hypothetical protein
MTKPMALPDRFVAKDEESKVSKLLKSLYDLNQ